MTPADSRARATTIKVPIATRDRLKTHAARAGETLSEHIEHLLDAQDRRERFEAIRRAQQEMTPEQRASYEAERDAWLNAPLA